jgi:hypothetical protein
MNPQITHRDKPCQYCRTEGSTSEFENLRTGDTPDKPVSYEALLQREAAAPAVLFLEYVFQGLGRTEVAALGTSVSTAVTPLVNQEFIYPKLRRTGPVIYVKYGLSVEEVSTITPFSESSIKDIIRRTPQVSLVNLDTQTLLKAVSEREPVTCSRLAENVEPGEENLRHRLKRLKERDRVAVSNNHHGPPAAAWRTTTAWNEPLSCDFCDFTSHSLKGVQSHERRMH